MSTQVFPPSVPRAPFLVFPCPPLRPASRRLFFPSPHHGPSPVPAPPPSFVLGVGCVLCFWGVCVVFLVCFFCFFLVGFVWCGSSPLAPFAAGSCRYIFLYCSFFARYDPNLILLLEGSLLQSNLFIFWRFLAGDWSFLQPVPHSPIPSAKREPDFSPRKKPKSIFCVNTFGHALPVSSSFLSPKARYYLEPTLHLHPKMLALFFFSFFCSPLLITREPPPFFPV